jgi:hypothetical protein
MPKVQLPNYLVESRWCRCALIKDRSHVDVPVAGWSWNPQESFAYAPGVHCFMAGQEYAWWPTRSQLIVYKLESAISAGLWFNFGTIHPSRSSTRSCSVNTPASPSRRYSSTVVIAAFKLPTLLPDAGRGILGEC